MDLFIKTLKKYQMTAIILVSVLLTVSFITATAEMGKLLREYVWRMFTYIVFAIMFIFLLVFKKEIFGK